MSTLKIFKVDESGQLAVNTPELLTVNSFRGIIKRDKAATTSTKLLAFKELAYVWWMSDYDSPVVKQGKSTKDGHKFAVVKIGLDADWVADDLVKQAITDYKECQYSVPKEVISELIKAFKNYGTIVNKIRKSLDTLVATNDTLSRDKAKEALELTSLLIDISKSIPREIKNLKEAMTDLDKEERYDNAERLRGSDDVIPDSANPSSDW